LKAPNIAEILKPIIMEVITFESKAYQELMAKLEQIAHSLAQATEKPNKENPDEWLPATPYAAV
jgi:histone H3/H4